VQSSCHSKNTHSKKAPKGFFAVGGKVDTFATPWYTIHIRMYMRIFVVIAMCITGSFFLSSPVRGQEVPAICNDDVTGKSEEQLKIDLALCNAEIAKWQGILSGTRSEIHSIDGDVKALTAKIKTAEATIKSKNIAISQLSKDINVRSQKIGNLEVLIDEGKQSLGQLIRRTNELDDYSLAEVVLDSKNLSEFFLDFDSFMAIQRGLEDHFSAIRETIAQTAEERQRLGEIQDQELDAKYEVETKKKTITKSEQEKKELLVATKKEAKSYEQIVADRQAKANQINAALFRLRGVDGGGIPFKDALAYAHEASRYTG
jgi:septal ring factor EnvC (AmiA/AmiB activator)